MRKILSSRVAMRSFAIIMSIAMIITLMPTSLYARAASSEPVVAADTPATDIALKATATANGEHSNWGILATNLNNGHEPTSSGDPGGSWHDYGIESADGTSWVQYDWEKNVTINSMSIYWMCDGDWNARIPKSAKVEYKDETGAWKVAGTYDASVMAAQVKDQYNTLTFDQTVTTKALRFTMERNADGFCSIHRLQVWGKFTPADVALKGTASASGEHSEWGIVAANLNNGHEPTSSGEPAGSWHDYGIDSPDGISWVQYDWDAEVTVDSMSVYWMCDSEWNDRIPKSAQVQYKDASGTWQTAATYDASIMATQVKDQYNELPFDKEIKTKCIRMTMVRNTDGFCSIHRWKIWGQIAEAPLSDEAVITPITDGYRLTNKYFVVETGKFGQITSLKIQGDAYPTNYVMNTKNATGQNTAVHQWMGELMFSAKVGDATDYTQEDTCRSDSGRKIELVDNKVVITYANASGNKAIKDFKVVETYSLVGNKLHWDITVTNTNEQKLTIGDFGLPLAFNEYWPGGEEIYETRTVDHSFVGKQSSYVYVTRPSGIGKYLLLTPDTTTGAGFEYQDHWRTAERASDEAAWCQDQAGWANGLNVFYIHSDYIKKTNRGYLENTKLELAPGESKTYSFNFSAADDEKNMKTTLYEEGVIDAVAVPGMAYSVNMPGKMYLHTKLNKDDITFDIQCPHETGLHKGNNTVNNLPDCKKTAENTYVKYEKTVMLDGEQYHIYDIKFADLGQNNVIVKYNSGSSQTVLQFYMMDDVASALTTHSEFMVDQTQWNTPLEVSDKVFDDWMMDTKSKRAETDANYWKKNYWGWGDDWGLTHGEFIAEKNVYQPVEKEISAVDEYLDIAIWNGLMREHQKDYLIHDFLMESPNSSPYTRGYAYPHIYNTYFSMYKIASKYPNMINYKEDANTYLLRAYHILKALYGSSISYNYSTGLMGELTTPEIIAALEKEGYQSEAQTVISIMAEKYKNFKDTKYPYGSEYSYDNTGEEAVYTLAKLNNATDTANSNTMMNKIDLKTRACRGLQPLWYQYANPVTNCGENWWQFQYTASLAGYCMDDWLRLQDNGMTETERAQASRVNYAAKLANLTSINSGQIDADPANVGAVAWTYQSEMGNLGGQGTGEGKLHNGWRQMAGEADLGLYGALQILSSDVVIDPVFGLFGYGCEVSENDGTYKVTPLDGLFTRLNFINQKLYIQLDRDQYTQAKVAADNTAIELSMKNLEGTAHSTDVSINGLVPGSYQVLVNGSKIGSFQSVAGKASTVALALPAASTATVTIKAGTPSENKAPVVVLDSASTVALSDVIRLDAKASDDGYVNSTMTYSWEAVTVPDGGAAAITNPTNCITDVSFNKVGEYVLQFTADDGDLKTSKQITITVTENPALPETIANYTFDEGTIVGTNLLRINSNTNLDYAELDDNSALVEGKIGAGVKYTGSIAGGYIELPEALTKNLTNATISVDVNLSDVQSNQTTLFELGEKAVVEFVNGNELVMTINGNRVSSGAIFAAGYWKNVELTAAGDDYTLYVDGVKKAELLDTGLILASINPDTERYLIGRSRSESEPFLKGVVDNFVVKSYTMTDEQLRIAYGNGEHTILNGKSGSVVTTVGVAPILPTQVEALYSDGVYEKLNVVWDAISPPDYANAGTFLVNGKFEGTDIAVTIQVIVTAGILQNIAGDAIPSAIIDTPADLGGVKGLNDGFDPASSRDTSHGVWHNWRGNQGGSAWIMYSWNTTQIITSMDLYFFRDGSGNFTPANYTIEYQNENGEWYPVTNAVGLGVIRNQYNHTSFDPVQAKAVRVTMNPATLGCGVIEWKVYGYKEGSVLDKSALNIAIATAEGLKSNLFSSGMEAVVTALANAKNIAANPSVTQETINAAANALNYAISSLVPVVANNLAYTAYVTTSFTSSWERTSAVNDGAVSSVSNSYECSHWGTWGNESAFESVTYSWGTPVKISSSDIYLWTDGGGIEVPSRYIYEYLDKDGIWKEVTNAVGYEVLKLRTSDPAEQPNLDGFNTTTFDQVTTKAFRVSVYKESPNSNGVGLVEWRVFGSAVSKVSAPIIMTNPADTTALPNDSAVDVSLISTSGAPVYAASVEAGPILATSGSAIYYTLDGSTPNVSSIPYQGNFRLTTTKPEGETITIKAIEVSDGLLDSDVVEKQVIFLPASSEVTPTPSETTPTPGEATPTPGEATPTPGETTPTPTEPSPTPGETTPTPTVPTPVPTEPTPTPGTYYPPVFPSSPSTPLTTTPAPVIINITDQSDRASTILTVRTKDDVMEIEVQVDNKQLLDKLKNAKASDLVHIPMITQELIKQIKDSKIKKINISVTIPNDAMTGDLSEHLDLILPATLLQAVRDAGIELNVTAKNEQGKKLFTWDIDGSKLDDKITTDVNLFLSVGKASDNTGLNKLLSSADKGILLGFNEHNTLPGPASLRFYAGDLTDVRDRTIYLYHYNADTNLLETLPYSSGYRIDSEGYITMNLRHRMNYVILTKPADSKMVSSLLEQVKVTPKKKTLYLGGTSGSEFNIKVTVPSTLNIVSSFSKQNADRMIGEVMVSFSSNNTDVVKVDSSGKVTAVGVGTASILTTITLYSNKTSVIMTTITVKEAGITFTHSKASMKTGDSYDFEVQVYGFDGKELDWKTSDKSILTVDRNGKVTARAKGTAYITVKVGDVTRKIKVVVK